MDTSEYMLNGVTEYTSIANRTKEDDEALIWNAELFQTTKRTHCSKERFDAIFNTTLTYITTTEYHMYMDIQRGAFPEEKFIQWLTIYFKRNFPEMDNEADYKLMYERLHTAVYGYYVLQPLIDHPDTSDIKICAPNDIRVRVKGKAYKSSSCFINVNDMYRFIEGIALRNGLTFTAPVITFTDAHDKNYILRFVLSTPMVNAVDYPYLHIRKVPKVKPDFNKLIKDKMLTPVVRDYLIDQAKLSRGIVFAGPPGCVDRETEFFNGKEWKSLADYKEGEKVLQFNPTTNKAELVTPLRYIKEPCDKMYHFETSRGINQTLSPEHRVLYYNHTHKNGKKSWGKQVHEISAEELATLQNNGKFYGGFKTDFIYDGPGINLTDTEIKVMLAVICDGTFDSRKETYNRCTIRVKKERKKTELEKILSDYGKPYKRMDYQDGYTRFVFIPPRKEKEFSADWYRCSLHQLQLICENVLKWDGSIGKDGKKSFETISKASADFVQFAFSACGYRATIYYTDRKGQPYQTGGKTYTRKNNSYTVVISNNTIVGMAWHKDGRKNNVKLEEVVPEDGYKYCFTVPTHALVLRRKDRIFISGNSGKTTALNAFLEYIPKTRETLVLQENDELFTKQSGFMFKHVTHGFQGEPAYGLEDLGRMALVEGCNEFIIGEVKGGEMRNIMTLLNAGGYSAFTVHSTNALETMNKLADLVKYGSDYSFDEARKMLKVMDTIVYMEQYQIQEILEVVDYDLETHEFIYRKMYKNPHPRWLEEKG